MRIAGQAATAAQVEHEETETDERGRTVQHMAGTRSAPQSRVAPSSAMRELWEAGDKINQAVWLQLYTAIVAAELSSPDTECDFSQCAAAADLAYFEYHLKQNPRLRPAR